MSLEEDHEHLGEQLRKAMASATAGQPDMLVFCLRGSEISARLVKMAELAEAEAANLDLTSASKNVRPIRSRLPMPPGYPVEQVSEEAQREMKATLARSYLSAAKDLRFLASHVEEERFFRLAIHDLIALGFSLPGQPMPIGYLR